MSGLLTTDLVALWLHWNQEWNIKERIVENYEGTHAETGLMTLYVNFPNPEAIQNLPESYEIYGHTIKIHHRRIANPCMECTALHPEITAPHQAGEECRILREAFQRDQELLTAANKIRANRSQNALFYPVLRVLPQNRHLISSATSQGNRLSFKLQRAQEEPIEIDIQLINREFDYAHVVSILESHEVI